MVMASGDPNGLNAINTLSELGTGDHVLDGQDATPPVHLDDSLITPPPGHSLSAHNDEAGDLLNHLAMGDLSSSGSRTSHETRNSLVFTPANHGKNSSAVSTDSVSLDGKSPRIEKDAIHLPDSLAFLNRASRTVVNDHAATAAIEHYVNEIKWTQQEGGGSNPSALVLPTDDFNNLVTDSSFERYDGLPNHIGLANEIPVNGFQDTAVVLNGENGAGMKQSV